MTFVVRIDLVHVGDITGGYKPPRRGRFMLREVTNIEAHEVIEDGDL